jgi:hypothetical protein
MIRGREGTRPLLALLGATLPWVAPFFGAYRLN